MRIKSNAIAKIINGQWSHITSRYNRHQIRTMDAIRRCRTASLGGHQYACDQCGKGHIRYLSCRNRHCPQCQNTQKEEWIQRQESRLMGSEFYHIVFTIPESLNEIFMSYPREMYAILMRVSWSVLHDFGWNHKYVGALTGATMVLHTWGSNLSYHPHVHCIVPAGGISLKGKWKEAKGKGKYLYPVEELSKVYRARMQVQITAHMKRNGMEIPRILKRKLLKHNWVVYCKPPFGGKQGVVRYLARYTHKTAITHHRLLSFDKDKVKFYYKDYRHRHSNKVMTLKAKEFIRRLSMHILPKGFCRIRHYGILSGPWQSKISSTEKPKSTTQWQDVWKQKGLEVRKCTECKKGNLIFIAKIDPVRGPPYYRNSKI